MPSEQVIYFDHNAATPLDPGVRAEMEPFLEHLYGNPSSIHRKGREARALLDDARDRLANVLQSKPSEIIFTSGGTEANNFAILGAARALKNRGRHLVTSQIEHHAVLECFRYLEKHEGFEVSYVEAGADGIVSPNSIEMALRPDTTLVSVMAANNETGAVQPVAEIGDLCHRKQLIFHTDAVQWFGKMPLTKGVHTFNADLVAGCSHKLHGPKGAGFLYVKSPFHPFPLIFGGPQENELRAGTENLAQIVGLVAAFERFLDPPVFSGPQIRSLRQKALAFLSSFPEINVLNPPLCLPNTLAFTVKESDSVTLVANLDLAGICVSAGAACTSGALEPSHVLLGMGLSPEEAKALVRISFGRSNQEAELEHFIRILPGVLARIKAHEQPVTPMFAKPEKRG